MCIWELFLLHKKPFSLPRKPQILKMARDKELHDISIKLTNQMLGNNNAFSTCYVCEVMLAMSTCTVHPLNTINNNTALCLLVN